MPVKLPMPPSPCPKGVSNYKISAAFEGTSLFLSPHRQCLPRSLALATRLTSLGANVTLVIGVANNPREGLLTTAEHAILADTGSEIVAGSTRMKAGTAQKAVLNLLSTTIMLRRGLVHQGLMVNMRVSNQKLRARAEAMVAQIAGVAPAAAARALDAAGEESRAAVLVAQGVPPAEASALLDAHDGSLAAAMAAGGA